MHSPLRHSIVVLAILFVGVGTTDADVLVGPTTLPTSGTDTSWGIQFTALQNVNLVGFDYHRLLVSGPSPFSGTITLTHVGSGVVFSTNYVPGAPDPVISFTGLSIALSAGEVYRLEATSDVQFGARDEVFQYGVLDAPPFAYPVSNAHLSVTSGVFNGSSVGFPANAAWPAFKNLQTEVAAVPEPVSVALFVALAGAGYCWRRHRRPA